MHRYLLIVFLVSFCLADQPADKKANAKTRATLDYIAGLPNQGRFIRKNQLIPICSIKLGKYLSGQFAGWSKVTFNMSQMIEIQSVTGHVPAILGCDYAAGWAIATPPQSDIDYSCNAYLKDHSNKKGLVTIDTHFPNPVSPNGGGLKNRSSLVFTDLLKPETETGKRWRSYLDIVAAGINDLQQAGVTVLYRPLHEMNGGWFWWGQQVRKKCSISFTTNLSLECRGI